MTMHLEAAILPPAGVSVALADLMLGVQAPPPRVVEEPRKGFFKRRAPVVAAPLPSDQQLALVPAHQIHVPLVRFGSVANPDLPRVRRALSDAAAQLPPVVVRVSGGELLEPEGDRHVYATLDGDITGLKAIFRTINEGVEDVGFFLDRRSFRPRLALGEVTDATTVEHLQAVEEALAGFSSEWWTIDAVSLMKRLLDRRPPESAELERIPLVGGPAAPQ